MEAWIGVAGALAGGAIALIGQYFLNKFERRERRTGLLLEQCAQVVALSEDFRNRVWEERHLGAQKVVTAWRLDDFRLAEARLKILWRDPDALIALDRLRISGEQLGKAWRRAEERDPDIDGAWENNRAAIDDFIKLAGGQF